MPACLVLAWCILSLVAVAGLTGPGRPDAQPSAGTAVSSTATSVASSTRAVLTSASAPAATKVTAARPAARPGARWTVRPGDTLSAVAAGLGVRGGWPALYAANRAALGPDPGLIRPGTVLAVPAGPGPARYTVAPGDTLSAVAAALGIRGGWPALYAANKRAIGPDPALISAGTVLTVPPPASPQPRPAPAGSHPARPAPTGTQPASRPAGNSRAAGNGRPAGNSRAAPARLPAPAGSLPRWLQDVLLAAGLLAATAFIAEPAAALARRRHGTARPAPPRPRPPGPAGKATIILADHERLIVTYCASDHAAYVLTPPGEDPRAVLRAARLVLPEDTYQDLAGRLGVPSAWPLE
jgi:LysM repeat protein